MALLVVTVRFKRTCLNSRSNELVLRSHVFWGYYELANCISQASGIHLKGNYPPWNTTCRIEISDQ